MVSTQAKSEMVNLSAAEILEGGDVLLIVSPLASTAVPVGSAHLLQAACRQKGIILRVFYSNLSYAAIIGPKRHAKIVQDYSLFTCDGLFSHAAFGLPAMNKHLDKYSNPQWAPDHLWPLKHNIANQPVSQVALPYREWFDPAEWKRLESLTTQWTASVARQIANLGFAVVGCSTTLGGLVPPIALLNGVKKVAPDTVTVLGGALCEEALAEGILSLKSGIDYVFSGEGEITFPALVNQVLSGQLPKRKIIFGEDVIHLDNNPLPDYQEYFQQVKKWSVLHPALKCLYEIPYETSRGCWYGKCTFCALNGKKNLYREKSPNRVINDLKLLIAKHPVNTVYMSDTSMPVHFFDTLLPHIPGEISSLNIRYEIKANLTLTQVLSLKKAGVISIEPGIESLSPSLLKRLRKGITVRENIALLRYARSVNLRLIWHILFGIPGDQVSDYEEMLRLFPLIRHLPPPYDLFSLKINRFSSYQTSPEEFAISNLRPAEVYEDILPAHAHLEKIAYYFTGDFPAQSHEHPEIITALAKEYQAWRRAWAAYEVVPLEVMLPTLHVTKKSNHQYILQDTRGIPGRPENMVLNREQVNLLLKAQTLDNSSKAAFQWALDADLGIQSDSWFIPLATAEPDLLLDFERDFEPVS